MARAFLTKQRKSVRKRLDLSCFVTRTLESSRVEGSRCAKCHGNATGKIINTHTVAPLVRAHAYADRPRAAYMVRDYDDYHASVRQSPNSLQVQVTSHHAPWSNECWAKDWDFVARR